MLKVGIVGDGKDALTGCPVDVVRRAFVRTFECIVKFECVLGLFVCHDMCTMWVVHICMKRGNGKRK
jgi:hypothetical protein